MEIKQIPFGTQQFDEAVALRREVLRIPLGLEFTKAELEAEKSDIQLGIYENNQLLGVLSLKTISTEEIKMRQVAVNPMRQSQGIGSALVTFSEKLSHEKGFKTISLHARENAVAFYSKLAYQTVGDPFLEVGIKHWKMIKNLHGSE